MLISSRAKRQFVGCLMILIVAGCGAPVINEITKLDVDASLVSARVGQPYHAKFVITGGTPPYSFVNFYGFPAGILFDNITGELSGTPVAPSNAISIFIMVQDSGSPPQSVEKTTTLVIKPLGVSITTDKMNNGNLLVYYKYQLTAINGLSPYTWRIGPAVGSLPNGLHLDNTTGIIAGLPTTKETQTFTVTVTDNDSPPTSYSKEFTIEIQ